MNYTKRLRMIGKLIEYDLKDANPHRWTKDKYRDFLVDLYESMSDEKLQEVWKETFELKSEEKL